MKQVHIMIVSLVITLMLYSIVAFAYIHDKFIGKDVFKMVCLRLDRIERKIDIIIGGK